jgi:hypothetical protein
MKWKTFIQQYELDVRKAGCETRRYGTAVSRSSIQNWERDDKVTAKSLADYPSKKPPTETAWITKTPYRDCMNYKITSASKRAAKEDN